MSELQPGLWVTPGATGSGTGPEPGVDKHYQHVQTAASSVWVVQHNLSKYANVTIINNNGDEIEASVRHDSIDQVTIRFSIALSGTAFCN